LQRSTTILFFFLTLLSLPLIGVNYWSSSNAVSCVLPQGTSETLTSANCSHYPATFAYVAPFSLAGQGTATSISFTVPLLNSAYSFSKGTVGMGYSFLDALICICFLLFIKLVAHFQESHADGI